MVEPFANIGDPDQMPYSAVSDLGLHCLPVACLVVSSLQGVKVIQRKCYSEYKKQTCFVT